MKRQHHCNQEPPITSRSQKKRREQERVRRPEHRYWPGRCNRRKAKLHRAKIGDSDQNCVNERLSEILSPNSTSSTKLTQNNVARVETMASSNRQSSEHQSISRQEQSPQGRHHNLFGPARDKTENEFCAKSITPDETKQSRYAKFQLFCRRGLAFVSCSFSCQC